VKTDAITKSYASLTSKELAALAFHYLCDGNELELTRIAHAVPTATYRGQDPEYVFAYDRLCNAGFYWALQHWKAQTCLLAACGGWLSMDIQGNRKAANRFRRTAESWESRLMALEIALDEVGAQSGLDSEAVYKLAGCERFEPIFIESSEPEHVEAAKAELRWLLT
jgi:hypothetical protein